MGNTCRLTDIDTGHDLCPPTAVSSCSGDTNCENLGVARIGDSLDSHGCIIHPSHGRAIVSGSPSVFCNGRAVAKIGSAISCGGNMATSAATVSVA